jgi:hypothetical protein
VQEKFKAFGKRGKNLKERKKLPCHPGTFGFEAIIQKLIKGNLETNRKSRGLPH